MQTAITGRCLCGSITYRAGEAALWQMHCHCESCRRATGSAFASFLGVGDAAFVWVSGEPAIYRSSPGVERFFCPACGTPLAYRATRFPGEIHLHAGTLDDPARFRAEAHVHMAEAVAWADIHDGKPRHAAGSDD
ncbi:MAG: GFA family protein [Paracoccaceae bacterium]